jgi:biopolymer transport protein ExbD
VDEERVAPDALKGVLQAHLAKPGNDDVLVVVRADSGAPYARVRDILEQTRAAGAKRVAIATRQDTKKTTEESR